MTSINANGAARYSATGSPADRLVIPDVAGMSAREAAHAYLDAGLMPVPWKVRNGTKVLALSGVTMHEIHTTHKDINGWNPRWSCALLTSRSSGLVVIDIDRREEFRAWVASDGSLAIPETAWGRTGRKDGSHLLFDARNVAPEDWPRQGPIPGGDVKSNGFVPVEPSLHPNGRPYLWAARELAPMGALAPALSRYRLAPRGDSHDTEQPIDTDALRAACLAAGEGEQRYALLEYVLRLQWSGYAAEDIVRLCVGLGLQNFDERRPWRAADFRGLLRRGEQYVATPAERETLASLPTLEALRQVRKPGRRWHDFTALVAGERRRPVPSMGQRSDGVALFYRGKEHSIYGETEAGKDMLLIVVVMDCLLAGLSVVWIDFEEGDEIETGGRLLNAGLDPAVLCDPAWFRYATPETTKKADECLREALRDGPPDLVVLNGITAAYALYGWPVKDWIDSPAAFRGQLVRPCLARGAATISTDHVTKENAERGSRSRYATAGAMKLNLVNGAAYLLEPVDPMVRGGEGSSRIILTKDRPGGIKPHCAPVEDAPMMRYAGTLTGKSVGDGRGELRLEIVAPRDGDGGADGRDIRLAKAAAEALTLALRKPGRDGAARNALKYGELETAVNVQAKDKAAAIRLAVKSGRIIRKAEGPGKPTWYRLPKEEK